jgi:hypothetical protein
VRKTLPKIQIYILINRSGRIENAFDRITECSSNLSKTSDILWLLLRSISKKILDIPIRFPANSFLDQAVKDDALLLICTDLSCDLFFFD